MNKAKDFTEFYNILKMNQIPGYNIGYADKNDTIFYISNGIIPKRKTHIIGKILFLEIQKKLFGMSIIQRRTSSGN